MNDKINELLERVEAFKPKAAAEIEDFRIRMLGKKGELTALMEEFKSVAPELKREFGQKLNNLKNRTQERINALRGQLADAAGDSSQRIPDMSRPGSAEELGSRHPISLVTNQIVEVFSRLGYTVAEGPEIEDDWHVFSALNFPPEHPARDMQDTFFIAKNPDVLLRTHTSSIQVRTMERQKPPIRVICPGHDPHAPLVLSLHRTVGRGRCVVQPLRRQGLQRLQGHGLAGDHGLRHGRSQCA